MKDEGAIDSWEGFPTSIRQGSKFKEGSWKGTEGKRNILCLGKKQRRRMKCEKEI
jgi:hypothetical protein